MIEVNKIIIRHARHIIYYDIIGILCLIGCKVRIIMGHIIQIIHVMSKDHRASVLLFIIRKKLLINITEHGTDLLPVNSFQLLISIDPSVILFFTSLQCLEILIIHLQIILSVAVLHDIDRNIIDDLRIGRSDTADFIVRVFFKQAKLHGILSVLAKVRDNIRYPHNTSFQCGRHQPLHCFRIGIALLHLLIKQCKILIRHRPVFLQLQFSIVADHTIQCLQADI